MKQFFAGRWAEAHKSRPFLLYLGGGVLVLVLVLVGAMPNLTLRSGEETGLISLFTNTWNRPGVAPWNSGMEGTARVPAYVIGIFWGALAVCVMYAVVSPEYRRTLFITVAMVLLVAFVLMRIRESQAERMEEAEQAGAGAMMQPPAVPDLPPAPDPPTWIDEPPRLLSWILMLIALSMAAGAGFWIWRKVQWLRAEDTTDQIVREAQHAITHLDEGQDVSDTVLRCYVGMVRAFERSERIRRSQAMTPREFEARLREAGLHTWHVHRLSELFELVRFGDKPTGERERQQARDCLNQIVVALGGTP